ncbi:MAG: glycosyltransferase [Clostridia bacterium]|nr:glycosyltransferase [Clostridia bacterium]
MRVLHLLQSNRFSGAENVVCQIISMMKDNPEIEMAYCSQDGQIREALAERGIKFYPLSGGLNVTEVKRVIKEYKPDVIHAHDMRASFIAARSAGKTKIVSHIHNSDFEARKISLKSVAYLLSLPKFSSVIWVSNSCFKSYYFSKLYAKKSYILYNVIDGESVLKRAQSDENNYSYDLAYVGRLANPKNPQRLVKIVSLLKKQKSDIKVAIVGSGDLEDETKSLAEELGVSENIEFLGFMSNPLGVLKSSKVMVMTSDREGLPMTALEAMALGVPIVSTPTDGLCDVVKPGVTGFLEWDEQKFANHLFELISNPEKQKEFSNATLSEFGKFNDINNYKDVLRKVYGIK